MNPAAFQPHPHQPRPHASPETEHAEKLTPASQSYLEPGSEAILFAVICLLCSAIIYCGVLLIRFLT
jgi:hypothetical protein